MFSGLRNDLLVGQAHLIRVDEAESFVERTPGFRSVQDETIEPLGSLPINDPSEKEHGYTLTTPRLFGEDIYDDGVPAFRDFVSVARAREWVRQNFAELDPGATGDDVWVLGRDCQPSDILAPSQEIAESLARFCAQHLECFWRDLAHLIEHARAMLSDNFRILGSSEANRESF